MRPVQLSDGKAYKVQRVGTKADPRE